MLAMAIGVFSSFFAFLPRNKAVNIEKMADWKYAPTIRVCKVSPLSVNEVAGAVQWWKDLGYDLLNEKIWKKSNEINMYRYNYAFVLCFGSKNYKSKNVKSFQNDIWFHPHKSYNGYTNNFSKDMILRCIENYTDIGETVLDIFMGVGTTAISCIESNRHYLGVEINTEVYESGISRLSAL